jgi:hypothetical protein
MRVSFKMIFIVLLVVFAMMILGTTYAIVYGAKSCSNNKCSLGSPLCFSPSAAVAIAIVLYRQISYSVPQHSTYAMNSYLNTLGLDWDW